MFKITIEETRTVKKVVGKDWAVVGSKEVDRDDRYYSDDPKEPKTRIENVYGYIPETERNVVETSQVYMQEVETLDFPAVISAINKMGFAAK